MANPFEGPNATIDNQAINERPINLGVALPSDQDTEEFLNQDAANEFERSIGWNDNPQFQTYFSEVQGTNLFYTEYSVCTLLLTETGVDVMPRAARTGGARVVRRHAPYSIKLIIWEAERRGGPDGERPTLPHWDTGDPNDVLCQSLFQVHAPKIQPGGTRFGWRVMGFYKYAMYVTLEEAEILQVAAMPDHNLAVDRLNAQGFPFSTNILKTLSPSGYDENVKTLSD